MTPIFSFKSLFIYSEKNSKFFFSEFSQGINLIYGPNTSGKSSLVQCLIYAFGINDGRDHLEELLELDIFVRVDGEFTKNGKSSSIALIRENGSLYIRIEQNPPIIFSGINGNSSNEHIKLKHFFHKLFNFELFLESKEAYKEAPIEAMFLPYYISQSVGWVYLRKSFSSLDFYRNFKDDYLDYYLGIETALDREAKKKYEETIAKISREQNFLTDVEQTNISIQVTKISDERFTHRSTQYVEEYRQLQEEVAEKEKEYLFKANELSFLRERKSVIARIKLNQNQQNPTDGNCPTCSQILPYSLQQSYIHEQQLNDSISQYDEIKQKTIKVQSEVNSLKLGIEKLKTGIANKHKVFREYSEQQISLDSWIDVKANTRLNENILKRLGQLTLDYNDAKKSLDAYKTEDEIIEERSKKELTFRDLFKSYLKILKVKELANDRYLNLYKISAFPFQGVELHKTIMAYHFAFNKLISRTPGIHRLPFILDAVFKEDLDDFNEDLIIEFIAKQSPTDTQLFMTISEKTTKESQVARYQKDFLNPRSKLIQIGNGKDTRTLLRDYNNHHPDLLSDTLAIINHLTE